MAALQAEPAEIASLRAKAEKGNAIAQYNLGLAYAVGREDLPADQAQAFVWLTLSGDSGSARKSLADVLGNITDAQLAEARRILESYHGTPAAKNLATATSRDRQSSQGSCHSSRGFPAHGASHDDRDRIRSRCRQSP